VLAAGRPRRADRDAAAGKYDRGNANRCRCTDQLTAYHAYPRIPKLVAAGWTSWWPEFGDGATVDDTNVTGPGVWGDLSITVLLRDTVSKRAAGV
jgi:hypothetical protein